MRTLLRIDSAWLAGKTLIVAIILAALALGIGRSLQPAAAPLSAGIVADVEATYDVHPDEGTVDVEWHVRLDNTGPSPNRAADSPLNQPTHVRMPFPGSVTDFAAITDGASLAVTEEDSQLGRFATIYFGRAVRYEETFAFTYSYMMTHSTEAGVIIRDDYVNFQTAPRISFVDEYASSVVHVLFPDDFADDVTIDGAACAKASGGFSCAGTQNGVFADVEAAQDSARITTSEMVEIEGRETELILRYFPEDVEWAEWVTDLAIRGIPILGDVFGTRYDGPPRVRISEKGGYELFGAAGLANCDPSLCAVAVLPDSTEHVLLHEFAHMWTEQFSNRWLGEGIAEYAAGRAGEILGYGNGSFFGDYGDLGDAPDFSLDRWNAFNARDNDDLPAEVLAYYWAGRFFHELEGRVGIEPFQSVSSEVIFQLQDGAVNSKEYMDLLEDTGGVTVDDMFTSYVFHERDHDRLAERRSARDRYAALAAQASQSSDLTTDPLEPIFEDIDDWNFVRAAERLDEAEAGLTSYFAIQDDLAELRTEVEAAGLTYPVPYEQANESWAFTEVEESLPKTEEAIAAYLSARDARDEPRDLFQRIGMLGKKPNTELQKAADAFAWTSFDDSIKHSANVESMITNSHSDGVTYTIILVVVMILMALFAVGWWWFSRLQDSIEEEPKRVEF